MFEIQSGHKLKTLRINGGGEYVSHVFSKYYDNERVTHDIVRPYTRL